MAAETLTRGSASMSGTGRVPKALDAKTSDAGSACSVSSAQCHMAEPEGPPGIRLGYGLSALAATGAPSVEPSVLLAGKARRATVTGQRRKRRRSCDLSPRHLDKNMGRHALSQHRPFQASLKGMIDYSPSPIAAFFHPATRRSQGHAQHVPPRAGH